MGSKAAAAKVAVVLAVAALFAAARAADVGPEKEAQCWKCYSSCMHKCDGYRDDAVRSANGTLPGANKTDGAGAAVTVVRDGDKAAVLSSDGAPAALGSTDGTTPAAVNKTDSAAATGKVRYNDDGDDEDEDEDEEDDDDKDKDEDEDEDEDDDNDGGDHGHSGQKDYSKCKKMCLVDCYKDIPAVCYKMCIAQTCLALPPYGRMSCYKGCEHRCFHPNHGQPGPKPGPKPKPPTPAPPKPTPPTLTPPKPRCPPKMSPKPKPLCPPKAPSKPKPKPKPKPPCPPTPAPPPPPPCPPKAPVSTSANNN